MAYTLTQFWFNLYTAYSGQRFYDDWYQVHSRMCLPKLQVVHMVHATCADIPACCLAMQAFYNLLFTSLPVIVVGLFDQDVSKVGP